MNPIRNPVAMRSYPLDLPPPFAEPPIKAREHRPKLKARKSIAWINEEIKANPGYT